MVEPMSDYEWHIHLDKKLFDLTKRVERIEKFIDNQTVIWAKAVEIFKSINNRTKLP